MDKDITLMMKELVQIGACFSTDISGGKHGYVGFLYAEYVTFSEVLQH